MDAKRFFNYFQTDKSKSPANEGQQIEKPVKTEPVEAKSEQSEAKSENPKMQQLSPAFARSEGEDGGVRSSIKRKLSESPVMSRSKSDHPESDQSTMKNSETSTKEISSSSTDAIEIDEESTGMDTSQSDDKRERSKRALRDRSKLKTMDKSLKSRVVFSSDDDSDYVLEDSEDSDESEESDEWNSDEDEDDYRKVTKRSRTNGYRSSFNRSNESKGEKAEDKCENKLKDEGISETGPVDYRPTVCVVDGGKKIPLQVASVNTKQDSSAVGSAVGSAVSPAVGPAVSSAASSGVSLLADRKPGDEYSFVNDTGLKIVYGVEYKPSE